MAIEINIKDACVNGGYQPKNLAYDETIIFPNSRKCTRYGHDVYNRYPARSSFYVPRAILQNFNEGAKVLDPFMGSGTTAVEASLIGAEIYGAELDPFARLIAETSIYRFSQDEELILQKTFKHIIENMKSYKTDANLRPNLFNVDYWFHEDVFEELLRLKTIIFNELPEGKIKNFFKIVFADSIKPASKMERQSTKPYISSKYEKKVKPVIESFSYSFNKHLQSNLAYKDSQSTEISWLSYDATNIVTSPPGGIDVAITSPPYLNAFDYSQLIKVESSWLGTTNDAHIKELRKGQVGHDKRIGTYDKLPDVIGLFSGYRELLAAAPSKKSESQKEKLISSCEHYYIDMYKNMTSIHNVLRKGGEYHIIVGDNIVSGVNIKTHKILMQISEIVGFQLQQFYKYPIKDHRTSIPRDNSQKISYEYVLGLKK